MWKCWLAAETRMHFRHIAGLSPKPAKFQKILCTCFGAWWCKISGKVGDRFFGTWQVLGLSAVHNALLLLIFSRRWYTAIRMKGKARTIVVNWLIWLHWFNFQSKTQEQKTKVHCERPFKPAIGRWLYFRNIHCLLDDLVSFVSPIENDEG